MKKKTTQKNSTAWWFDYEEHFSSDGTFSGSTNGNNPSTSNSNDPFASTKSRNKSYNPFRKKTDSLKSILEKLRTPGYDWHSEWLDKIWETKKQTK